MSSREAFPGTRCSLLERLHGSDEQARRAAFDALVNAYWQPIYTYLRLRWGQQPADAQDLTQGFLTQVWERDYFAGFDPARARFRTFLRVCLDRFTQNRLSSERAEKRGGGAIIRSIDLPVVERALNASTATSMVDDVDELFRREVVRALLARAVEALREELARRDRTIVFNVFERYDLIDDGDRSYASIAVELGIPVTHVTNHLHAARRRFRAIVLDQLRALSDTPEELREDARELLGVNIP